MLVKNTENASIPRIKCVHHPEWNIQRGKFPPCVNPLPAIFLGDRIGRKCIVVTGKQTGNIEIDKLVVTTVLAIKVTVEQLICFNALRAMYYFLESSFILCNKFLSIAPIAVARDIHVIIY